MEILQIVVLFVGAILFTVSFFIPDKQVSTKEIREKEEKIIKDIIDKELADVRRKVDEITEFILHDLHSGASLYEATGAYDKNVHTEIVTIVDKQEYSKLMDYMHKTDPKAFITVYSVNEVSYVPKKIK